LIPTVLASRSHSLKGAGAACGKAAAAHRKTTALAAFTAAEVPGRVPDSSLAVPVSGDLIATVSFPAGCRGGAIERR
jgi:hypothetical protein